MKVQTLLREPLLHFLALGAVIFGADRALAGPVGDDDPRRLRVSADMVEVLVTRHIEKTGRPPDAPTRAALVDELVRGEVLQREARALGLDRGDLVVQRRLAQKMEFLLESQAELVPPTDAELRAWRDAHPECYRRRDRLRFEQRLFSSARRGERAEVEARDAWAELTADPDMAPPEGDPSAHGPVLSLPPVTIQRRFGADFAAAVSELPVGGWRGPIRSRQGFHLVRVIERLPEKLPELDELRDRLREDLLRDRRVRTRESAIRALMAEYEVEVDLGEHAEVSS